MTPFPQSGTNAFLEARLRQIAEWPEDSAVNLRIIAKQALRDYYDTLREYYTKKYESPEARRDRLGIDWG